MKDVIRNLEMRIAKLEKLGGLLPVSSDMHFTTAYEVEKEAIDYLKDNNPGVDWDVSSVEFKKQDENSGYVEITGRFRTKDFVVVEYYGNTTMQQLEKNQPFRNAEFNNTTYGNFASGEVLTEDHYISIEYNDFIGIYTIERHHDNGKDEVKIETTFKPDVDASLIVKEVNKLLR